jgi:hypothetical protein
MVLFIFSLFWLEKIPIFNSDGLFKNDNGDYYYYVVFFILKSLFE